jgi:hypothetical protein
MDDRQFDGLSKTLTNGGSRRVILQTLGGSALVALFGRIALDSTEAKKKRKKKKTCKGNTTKCGKKACCRVDQTCEGGRCVDDVAVPECASDAECDVRERCQNGICVEKQAA